MIWKTKVINAQKNRLNRLSVLPVVYCLIFSIPIFAENPVDSLKTALAAATNPSQKNKILDQISEAYIRCNPTLAKLYNKQSLSLAEQYSDTLALSQASFIRYKICKYLDVYDEALGNLYKTKEYSLKTKNIKLYTTCLIEQAFIYEKQQHLAKAMTTLNEARAILEWMGDESELSRLYSILGILYFKQGRNDEAITFHNRSLSLNIKRNFLLGISVNYVNLGVVYINKKGYETAIVYLLKALEIKKKLHDEYGILKCINNLGVSYANLKKTKEAIDYHQKALEAATKNQSVFDQSMTNVNLGFDYYIASNYPVSIRFSLIGLKMAEENNFVDLKAEACKNLSECYAQMHDFQKAYEYHLTYKENFDSLQHSKFSQELYEIQERYASVQKDNEINTLKITTATNELEIQSNRNYLLLFAILLITAILIGAFLFLQWQNNRRIKEKLKELNEIKTAFFANLSHEFRTPLTLMLGPLEVLLEKASGKDKLMLQLAYRNAKRILQLDEQLLEFTKLDSGNIKLRPVKADIFSLISVLVEAFSMHAVSRNINYVHQFSNDTYFCYFDPDIVEKVIGNLISNAIKYTPDGGKVWVNVSLVFPNESNKDAFIKNEEIVVIEIGDTGNGIPEEKQDKIFERFYQLKDYKGKEGDGFGIGLSLVKELVEIHKGNIELESEFKKGSIFRVSIPVSAHSHAQIIEKTSHISEVKVSGTNQNWEMSLDKPDLSPEKIKHENEKEKAKILVVDDNPDIRIYLNEIFKETYRVFSEEDGISGIKTAHRQMPDIIITDIMMERMDGMEFCRTIKSDPNTRHIPVIMLTALSDTLDRITGFQTGADDYLKKPFNTRELLIRVENLLKQRTYLKELFSRELKMGPEAVSVASADAVFLQKLIKTIEEHIDDLNLDVNFLASAANMSRSQLHRRITSLTGQPATAFIRLIRIKRAAQLIEQNTGNIAEIMYASGFNNPSYFSRSFKEIYNMSPSEYQQLQHQI